MRDNLGGVPGFRRLFSFLIRILIKIHAYLDGSFDRKYGVDTSGNFDYSSLTGANKNIHLATGYEAIAVKMFRQIMRCLTISFNQFEFIDFGSGKGRVLILASEYGFKKIIGVEFLPELHQIAAKNVMIYERHVRKASNIETICMDATEFPIPVAPLVIFSFNPFTGKVLERVLNNITISHANNARKIILISYASNTESTELFKATKFQYRELKLRDDWTEIHPAYSCFLFQSAEGCYSPHLAKAT